MIKSIGIIGATGMLGKPVAKQLLNSKFEIKIIARNPEKVKTIFPDSAIIKADLNDINSLENSLKQVDAVYLNLHIPQNAGKDDWLAEREGVDNLIRAARKAGTKRISYLSSIVKDYQNFANFNWWVFNVKQGAVDLIKKSGIPYTIFYPSSFMENFIEVQKSGNKILLVGEGKSKMYFIAGEDYAKQVVKSFEILNEENKEYFIQGTESYNYSEAANIFIEHYKKEKLKISNTPMGLIKFLGLFSKKMDYTAKIIQALNEYPEKFESENSWKELGRPEITIKEFASRF